MLDQDTLNKVLHRGVSEIIVEEEFVKLLQEGKPLRLKMGFDPSRPDIHLGHVVGLRKLRQLQDLGHQVILIVGDWTAQIGDPSGESVTRPMLTHDEVMANAESYLAQFFKVVDRDRAETVLQSEWFGKFTLATVIDLTRRFTLAQLLERDDFSQRFQANRPIALTELLYPLLQAYDSVAIRSDVEFGGTDQKFNLLVGRQLQTMMGQQPQHCFLMPMLVGTDGVQKMSKSLDNYVAVDDPPNEMFGKVMSISDALILDYYDYLTDVPDAELGEMRSSMEDGSVNPMELKKRLALEITRQFYDAASSRAAQGYFEQAFQRRDVPEEIPEIRLASLANDDGEPVFGPGRLTWSTILKNADLASSTSEAKRLIRDGAVDLLWPSGDSTTLKTDGPAHDLVSDLVIKVGKRRFARLVDLD